MPAVCWPIYMLEMLERPSQSEIMPPSMQHFSCWPIGKIKTLLYLYFYESKRVKKCQKTFESFICIFSIFINIFLASTYFF